MELRLAQVAAGPAALTPLPTAESVINRNTDPYAGSIPQGKATAEPIDLTVEDALDRGLKYNLGFFLSNQTTAEARAARLQSLSELLPEHQRLVLAEELQRLNLKAFGFKFAGFPSSVGPFGLTATQATGSWNAAQLLFYRQIPCHQPDGEGRRVQLSGRTRHRGARRGRQLPAGDRAGIST